MKTRYPRPKWLGLYIIMGGFLGALWLLIQSQLPDRWLTGLEIGMLLVFWKLVTGWLNNNRIGLLDMPAKSSPEPTGERKEYADMHQKPDLLKSAQRRWSLAALTGSVVAFFGDFMDQIF